MSRIEKAFANGKAFIAFLTAGAVSCKTSLFVINYVRESKSNAWSEGHGREKRRLFGHTLRQRGTP